MLIFQNKIVQKNYKYCLNNNFYKKIIYDFKLFERLIFISKNR